MLTQEQKDQLEPLTFHPKYGKLLQEAIKGWKKVNPKKEKFGVYWENGEFKLTDEKIKGCCLLGSVMIGKKSDSDFVADSIIFLFQEISEDEICKLILGFDDDTVSFKTEAYEFGLKINKILFA